MEDGPCNSTALLLLAARLFSPHAVTRFPQPQLAGTTTLSDTSRLFLTDYNTDGGGLTLQTLRSTSRSSDLGSLLISFVDRMEGWLIPGLVVGGYIVSRLFNI